MTTCSSLPLLDVVGYSINGINERADNTSALEKSVKLSSEKDKNPIKLLNQPDTFL